MLLCNIHIYDLPKKYSRHAALQILRCQTPALLTAVKPNEDGYATAQSVLRFLLLFGSIDDESDIPNNSILREFIGKSCFFTSSGDLKEQ